MKIAQGIVIDFTRRTIRMAKVRRSKETRTGKVIDFSKKDAALVRQGHIWPDEKKRRKRYVLLKEGDPRPHVVEELKDKSGMLKPADYDSETFKAAITSRIGVNIMNERMDWKMVALLILGVIVLAQIAVMYALANAR